MPYTFNPFTGSLDNTASTIKGDSAYTTVQANSSSWTGGGINGEFLPLSGGNITGNLSVSGNVEIGTSSTATIYVQDFLVGINTETPNEELTVVGSISSTETIYFSGGNTNNLNSLYSSVQSNSATTWNYQGTDLKSISANWENTYTTVQSKSAIEWDNSLVTSYVNGNFLALSGGTMSGKLIASADSTSSKLNIGNALSGAQPSVVSDGDIWITNQNKFSWRSNGNSIVAAGINQQNIFNNAQTIAASTPLTLLTVTNTGSGSAAIFSTQGNVPTLRLTQTGNGNALVVEDSTNPDATPFIVDAIGSVGIGLSSLSGIDSKLTVVGDVSANGSYYGDGSKLTGILPTPPSTGTYTLKSIEGVIQWVL